MTAETRSKSADAAIVRRSFRQVWIGATVWAVVFGGSAASSALTYVSTYPTAASRHEIAVTTGRDTGFAVLLGPVSAIGTVGGYTVYKVFVFLTSIGAIWALLATTRLLRAEEDAGRWQLVLAGDTSAPRSTVATLLALGLAVVVLFGGTTLIVLLAGRDPDLGFGPGETALYGLSIAIAPAVFVAVAALTSQLARTRRLATSRALGVFGVAFVLRMIADSGSRVRWLLWLTPFGWTERMRPFTENDPWPLLPAAATVFGLCAAATALAARRDAGDGVLASADASPLRPRGLGSPLALATRLELPSLGAWCAGAAATAFAFGILAKVTTGPVTDSVGDALDKFGVHGSFVNQYLSVTFLFAATLVSLIAANQVGAASDEETSGRLVHVLVAPTDRTALIAGRLALAAAAIVVAGLLAGLAGWLGVASQGIDVGFGSMVGAGLNLVPTALVALGIGAVALAVAPRLAARVVYAVVVGSLLVNVLGATVSGADWAERVSLFHYMALAPAESPDTTTIAVGLATAVALCAVATMLFRRRDVQTA